MDTADWIETTWDLSVDEAVRIVKGAMVSVRAPSAASKRGSLRAAIAVRRATRPGSPQLSEEASNDQELEICDRS